VLALAGTAPPGLVEDEMGGRCGRQPSSTSSRAGAVASGARPAGPARVLRSVGGPVGMTAHVRCELVWPKVVACRVVGCLPGCADHGEVDHVTHLPFSWCLSLAEGCKLNPLCSTVDGIQIGISTPSSHKKTLPPYPLEIEVPGKVVKGVKKV
jgi:hypothetical protein